MLAAARWLHSASLSGTQARSRRGESRSKKAEMGEENRAADGAVTECERKKATEKETNPTSCIRARDDQRGRHMICDEQGPFVEICNGEEADESCCSLELRARTSPLLPARSLRDVTHQLTHTTVPLTL